MHSCKWNLNVIESQTMSGKKSDYFSYLVCHADQNVENYNGFYITVRVFHRIDFSN